MKKHFIDNFIPLSSKSVIALNNQYKICSTYASNGAPYMNIMSYLISVKYVVHFLLLYVKLPRIFLLFYVELSCMFS